MGHVRSNMSYDIYRDPPDPSLLEQGDILAADKLRDSLRGHQDYFAKQEHFPYYMVLTQTCDLARGGVDFVFLAAVRHLRSAFKYCQVQTKKAREKQQNFVRDLYRHQYNRRGYFYLPRDSARTIDEDCVADLRVMFSLHKTHYSAMLESRVCAITEVYEAQLGHIAGHMFNRVAVPDNAVDLQEQVAKTLNDQGERYEKRLAELLSECQGICAVRTCQERADRFRSLPHFTESDELVYQDRVLCKAHARQWDQDRAFQ